MKIRLVYVAIATLLLFNCTPVRDLDNITLNQEGEISECTDPPCNEIDAEGSNDTTFDFFDTEDINTIDVSLDSDLPEDIDEDIQANDADDATDEVELTDMGVEDITEDIVDPDLPEDITNEIMDPDLSEDIVNQDTFVDEEIFEDVPEDTFQEDVSDNDTADTDPPVDDSVLYITLFKPPYSFTIPKGRSGVPVVAFELDNDDFIPQNPTAKTVTGLRVTILTDDDDDSFDGPLVDPRDHIDTCHLITMGSGDYVALPESPNSSGELNFENFDWPVAIGETNTLAVNCRLTSESTSNGDDDHFVFGIVSVEDIVAENQDGDIATVVLGNDNLPSPFGTGAEVIMTVTNQ